MIRLLVVFTVSGMILIGYGSQADASPGASGYPEQVSWQLAVEILESGQVESVYQLHNLEVTLELLDGTAIKTVEPSIDAVFAGIDKCGQPCSNIMPATE